MHSRAWIKWAGVTKIVAWKPHGPWLRMILAPTATQEATQPTAVGHYAGDSILNPDRPIGASCPPQLLVDTWTLSLPTASPTVRAGACTATSSRPTPLRRACSQACRWRRWRCRAASTPTCFGAGYGLPNFSPSRGRGRAGRHRSPQPRCQARRSCRCNCLRPRPATPAGAGSQERRDRQVPPPDGHHSMAAGVETRPRWRSRSQPRKRKGLGGSSGFLKAALARQGRRLKSLGRRGVTRSTAAAVPPRDQR